jgi:PAS domain S-box-containing protein
MTSTIYQPQSDALRIVILEDVATDAELIERELHKAGIACTSKWVSTRETFLKELETFSPDMILSDYLMPQFNGMEALELVKARCPSIPFIIVTGSMNEETAVECMKNGAADYVLKEGLKRLGPAVEGALENTRIKAEKERVEEQLLQLHKAVETMQLGVTVIDLNRKILYTNPADAAMHGYTVEELIGRDVGIFAPAELRQVMTVEEIEATKNWVRESINIRKDGSRFPVQLISDVVRNADGQAIAMITTCEDITERKQAEEVVWESQKRLKRAEQISHIGHWEMDIATGKSIWSDEFFRLCGFEPGAFEPTAEIGFQIIHPDDRERAAQGVQKTGRRPACQIHSLGGHNPGYPGYRPCTVP